MPVWLSFSHQLACPRISLVSFPDSTVWNSTSTPWVKRTLVDLRYGHSLAAALIPCLVYSILLCHCHTLNVDHYFQIIEKVGRRRSMMFCAAGCSASMATLAALLATGATQSKARGGAAASMMFICMLYHWNFQVVLTSLYLHAVNTFFVGAIHICRCHIKLTWRLCRQ